MLVGHLILSNVPLHELFYYLKEQYKSLNLTPDFHWFALAGFAAQLVDGALGMGYGLTTTTVLLSLGLNPAAISGSVHTAEIFTSGASGYSHYRFGNVNKKLFKILLIPGIIGAILGALVLIELGEKYQAAVKPVMAVYTMFLGVRIFYLGVVNKKPEGGFKHYGLLAGSGAFLDSFGGGGWGPIVTSTLVSKGRSPRYVIGTVSLTEFFITLASASTFLTMIGITHWQVIVALVIGGLMAAPLAA
ncbi:MAG: ABC transporter permease, partial [Candidatus Nephrothrix sp. EaCA]